MKATLLVIDVQKGMDAPCWGKRNNPQAESNIAAILNTWRKHDLPLVHIKHCSTNPESPLRPDYLGNDFKAEALPLENEKLFSKTVNSAFIGTELESYLHKNNISELVIVGLTTDHCVSTTTRMAANLGFKVTLISDATATFERTSHDGTLYSADEMHNINLTSLNDEFCNIVTSKELLANNF